MEPTAKFVAMKGAEGRKLPPLPEDDAQAPLQGGGQWGVKPPPPAAVAAAGGVDVDDDDADFDEEDEEEDDYYEGDGDDDVDDEEEFSGWTFRMENPHRQSTVILRDDGTASEIPNTRRRASSRQNSGNGLASSAFVEGVGGATGTGEMLGEVEMIQKTAFSKSPSTSDAAQAAVRSADAATRSTGWSFSSRVATEWNVTSKFLLAVTYCPVEQAVPEYTNISAASHYLHSAFGTCSSSSSSASGTRRRGCVDRMFGPRPVEFKRDVYTTADIEHVEVLARGVRLRGLPGVCSCIRVHLQPAREKRKRQRPGTLSREFIGDADQAPGPGQLQRQSSSARVLEGVDRQFERSTSLDHFLPTTPNNPYTGYNSNNQRRVRPDTLPMPTWRSDLKEDDEESYTGRDGRVPGVLGRAYGPIITFAIPRPVMHQDQEDYEDEGLDDDPYAKAVAERRSSRVAPDPAKAEEDGEWGTAVSECAPLLWKVEFPPDPSMAIQNFTVMDGSLNLSFEEAGWGDVTDSTSAHEDEVAEGAGPTPAGGQSEMDQWSYPSSLGDHEIPTNVYINGFQSWSFAGSVRRGDVQPTSAMPKLFSGAFNQGATLPPSPTMPHEMQAAYEDLITDYEDTAFYRSDFFSSVTSHGTVETNCNAESELVDEAGGPALVVGWLSQHRQFGMISFDAELREFSMHCSLDGAIASRKGGFETDWSYCQIVAPHCYDEEPMVHFLTAVAAHNGARPLRNGLLTGWCSWYHYFEKIDAATLRENFKRLNNLKVSLNSNVSIVDDGYMTAWGDWASVKPQRFPEVNGNGDPAPGMEIVAGDIANNEMRPGLWLAPFSCDKHSQVAKSNPGWIIRNNAGRAANSANCGKFFYGLDATNPEVRQHVYAAIARAVHQWGYRVLKLDFLYAACLQGNGKHDLSLTRAEAMDLALQTIRAAAGPNVYIIGCGCPIGSAIGYVDGMRISADTGPTWYPAFPLPSWDNGTLPSLRAMVRNSLTRSSIGHRWWHNDPDCLLLGTTTKLTDVEVMSAATVIGMSGGMLLLSDDLPKLSTARLRIGTKIFPMTGASGVVLDLHNRADTSLPSLMRLWCTDVFEAEVRSVAEGETARRTQLGSNDPFFDVTVESAAIAKTAAFSPDRPFQDPDDRIRNCVHVTKGLGTWSVLSFSNWKDAPATVRTPFASLTPPPLDGVDEYAFGTAGSGGWEEEFELGFHVFAFWSSKYIWVPQRNLDDQRTLSKRLDAHESEIFHVKGVTPDRPQYIGSDLHFTCGYEVRSFSFSAEDRSVDLYMKNDYKRTGFVYLYVPGMENDITVMVNGEEGRFEVVGRTPLSEKSMPMHVGRVIRIQVVIHAISYEHDGRVEVSY